MECCGALRFEVIEKSLGFEFVEEFSSPVWTELGRHRPPGKAKPKAQRVFEYVNEGSVIATAAERRQIDIIPERHVVIAAPHGSPRLIDGYKLGLEARGYRICVCTIGLFRLRRHLQRKTRECVAVRRPASGPGAGARREAQPGARLPSSVASLPD